MKVTGLKWGILLGICLVSVMSMAMRLNPAQIFSEMSNTTTEPHAAMGNYNLLYTPFEWIDMTNETVVNLGDDDYRQLSFPFVFSFYGLEYNHLHYSSNGYVSFSTTNPWQYYNPVFPSTLSEAQRIAAVFWDDMTGSGSGGIYTRATDDYVGISYIDYQRYNQQGTAGTFQIVFYPNGNIQFNYLQVKNVAGGYTAGLNYGDGVYYNSYTEISETTVCQSILFTPGVQSDTILSHPLDSSFEQGVGTQNITWTATDATLGTFPTYTINFDNAPFISDQPWASGVPIILDTSAWLMGIHNVRIFVYDGLGGFLYDDVIITVTPPGGNIAPVFSSIPADIQYTINDYHSYSFQWVVSDETISGTQSYSFYRRYAWGGLNLYGSGTWQNGQPITYGVSWWGADLYDFELYVYDGFGLSAIDTVRLQVYPASNTPPQVTQPEDFTVVDGDPAPPHISWTITDNDWANGRYYTITENGILRNTWDWWSGDQIQYDPAGLPVGVYEYEIYINDAYGGTVTDYVMVTVAPNKNPIISPTADLQYSTYATDPLPIQWLVDDDTTMGNPMYTIRINGSLTENGFWLSKEPITFEWDTIGVGTYVVTLEVDDGAGGFANDTINVIVNESPSLSSPQDINYVSGSTGTYPLSWNITDSTVGGNPTFEIYQDNFKITEGTWASNQIVGDINVAGLSVGRHVFKIVVFDGTGLNSTDTVIITVSNPPTPGATSQPIPPPFPAYGVVLIVLGVGLVGLIVWGMVAKKRILSGNR